MKVSIPGATILYIALIQNILGSEAMIIYFHIEI